MKPFKNTCVGGTFDHLHEGHKSLLTIAASLGDFLFIGLTTDVMLDKKAFRNYIESFEERKSSIMNFLEMDLCLNKNEYLITALSDSFGNTIFSPELQALVSSTETYATCLKINRLRIKRGFTPLIIITVPEILNSYGKKLSSTDIRDALTRDI